MQMPTGSGKTYVYDPIFSVKHRIIEISAILRMKYELEHGSSDKVISSHWCRGNPFTDCRSSGFWLLVLHYVDSNTEQLRQPSRR